MGGFSLDTQFYTVITARDTTSVLNLSVRVYFVLGDSPVDNRWTVDLACATKFENETVAKAIIKQIVEVQDASKKLQNVGVTTLKRSEFDVLRQQL